MSDEPETVIALEPPSGPPPGAVATSGDDLARRLSALSGPRLRALEKRIRTLLCGAGST